MVKLASSLYPELRFLGERALRGRSKECAELLDLAGVTTLLLEEVQRRHPAVFKRLAEKLFRYPMLVSPHPEWLEAVRVTLIDLGVGRSTLLPRSVLSEKRSGRVWSPRSMPARLVYNRIAEINGWKHFVQLYGPGVKVRRRWSEATHDSLTRLPEMSQDTTEAWFAAIWRTFLDESKGAPEKDEHLRPIGLHRRRHYQSDRKKGQALRTEEANIRDGIRLALKATFKRMLGRSGLAAS